MIQALCKKLEVKVSLRDEPIAELLKKTDIHHVADALEERMPDS
jgi:hypothetical protein